MADQAVPEGGPKPAPVVIKKYANRRLYNTATSAYVTLEHLSQMVKDKTDFVVYDAKTGDEITRSVLTQIIFEEESKGGQTLLPIPFLRQLISFYGDSLQGVVPQYLEMSMTQFARNQDQMRRYLQNAFGFNPFQQFESMGKQNMALFENAMRMFNPFGTPPGGQTAPPPTARSRRSPRPQRRRPTMRRSTTSSASSTSCRPSSRSSARSPDAVNAPPSSMARRVVSPCIGICTLDRKSGFCLGCKRTIEEIGRWQLLDDDARQAILDQLPGRAF
jgi:polyhydroxyalkanoate synthesis repressor PhaR